MENINFRDKFFFAFVLKFYRKYFMKNEEKVTESKKSQIHPMMS